QHAEAMPIGVMEVVMKADQSVFLAATQQEVDGRTDVGRVASACRRTAFAPHRDTDQGRPRYAVQVAGRSPVARLSLRPRENIERGSHGFVDAGVFVSCLGRQAETRNQYEASDPSHDWHLSARVSGKRRTASGNIAPFHATAVHP